MTSSSPVAPALLIALICVLVFKARHLAKKLIATRLPLVEFLARIGCLPMCHLPVDITEDENIVRAILCPAHVKQGSTEVKHQAFRSRPGTDEVSVIRHSHMGSDFCKQKGKEIEAGWPRNFFVGLSVIRAASIQDCGSTIHDSREEYCGHAHISHGFMLPPNEPPPPEMNLILTDRCKALRDKSVYHPDRDTTSPKWTGAAL